MNYNSYFNPYTQVGGPQMQQPMIPQQIQQNTQPKSNRVWVSGEEGAKSYLIAANTSVDLWDSESQTIYIKSADMYGKPSMQIIDYTIRGSQDNSNVVDPAPSVDFATKDDISSIQSRIDELENKLERVSHKKKNNHNKGGLNHEQSNAND